MTVIRGGLRLHQAQSVAVVGGRRPHRRAEHPGQREPGGDRQRIPARDVHAGEHRRGQTAGTQQLEARRERLPGGGGSGDSARQHGGGVTDQGDNGVPG